MGWNNYIYNVDQNDNPFSWLAGKIFFIRVNKKTIKKCQVQSVKIAQNADDYSHRIKCTIIIDGNTHIVDHKELLTEKDLTDAEKALFL